MNRIILFLTLLSNLITISVTFTVSSPRQAFPLCINQRTTKQQQRQQCPFSPSISSPVRDIEVNSKILPPMLMSSAVANMDDENNEVSSGGTATMSNLMFNLVKSIVGAGVLSLPSGIAAFASAPSAVIPAVCLISSMGIASSYMFSLIGRVRLPKGVYYIINISSHFCIIFNIFRYVPTQEQHHTVKHGIKVYHQKQAGLQLGHVLQRPY